MELGKGGQGRGRGLGAKEGFIEMLISYSVAFCRNRNPEECTLKASEAIMHPSFMSSKRLPGGKIVTPEPSGMIAAVQGRGGGCNVE